MEYNVLEQKIELNDAAGGRVGTVEVVLIARCTNLAAAKFVAEAVYAKRFGFYFVKKARDNAPKLLEDKTIGEAPKEGNTI
jgi:hypothetical protein